MTIKYLKLQIDITDITLSRTKLFLFIIYSCFVKTNQQNIKQKFASL